MLKSMDMYTSECSFQQEAALQSVMPFLKISPKLEKKGAAQCADQRRRIQLYLHQL